MSKNIIKELLLRKLIFQSTNIDKMKNLFFKNNIKLYCGFDPTADSLHIGHILPLILLKRFQEYGHTPIILLGGGTSLIGDPSFKNCERELYVKKKTFGWIKKISAQISSIFNSNIFEKKIIILNNYDWLKNLNLLKFLRKIGKFFSINSMINKESVKKRLLSIGNKGLSFTEFSYSLLQAYDYYFLYKKYNVKLQIGGSDQWGNITSGIQLIKKKFHKNVFGLTLPLLVQKNGKKFGKSEKNTVWLDKKKTSVYDFYQFWLNIKDEDVYKYLNFFTFLKIYQNFDKNIKSLSFQNIIKLKKILAKEMTILIHGKENFNSAKKVSYIFFKKNICSMKIDNFLELIKNNAPHIILNYKNNSHLSLKNILILTKLSCSKKKSKNMILSNSIMINKKIQNNVNYVLKSSDKIFNKYTIISKGKKQYFLICWSKL
ncbi:tyrosine--tRNA ligase [Buchnera aphidicola]|uniref:tyrosine--tRNA ligase n=1 Tax=Buchnera aphidicola TaxID=9 RepID=UPI0030ED4771